jgi:hypothetical protein
MARLGVVARASWALGVVMVVLAAAPARVERPVRAAAADRPAAPQTAQTPAKAPETVLAKLERGRWEVRKLSSSAPPQSICLGDPAMLMQLEHGPTACAHQLVSSDERGVTIRYSCPGDGFGQTSLRLETPRLAKIETQGIHGKAPFAQRVEARRIGDC